MKPQALYVHVPFCRRRCGYCNFTVSVSVERLAEPYLQALQQELSTIQEEHPVRTKFFGGGTPTHLKPSQLDRLFRAVHDRFPALPGAEISVEVNPEDIRDEICEVLARWGVNRVSLGAQSFSSQKLQRLERSHTAETIARAVQLLRRFCQNISLDLIFAAPEETSEGWLRDLHEAAACQPRHVSTYGLTFERGTTFWGQRLRGEIQSLDESRERRLYEMAIDFWNRHGFEHYEVSNFAQPGYRCRHNQVYWRGEEYFALGPGAARYVDGCRETNHRSTTTYIKRLLAGESPVHEKERLNDDERLRERIVLRMRMMEGIPIAEFEAEQTCSLEQVLGPIFSEFQTRGWWEVRGGNLRLTREGLMISDALWPHVLDSTAERHAHR